VDARREPGLLVLDGADLAFAGSLAVVGLSLAGLTEHDLSRGAEESSDTRKSRLAAAA
jgi:hypothetical protein